MFWVGVAVAVGLICLLTWIGAGMVRGGQPNDFERGRKKDGAFIPEPHDEEFF